MKLENKEDKDSIQDFIFIEEAGDPIIINNNNENEKENETAKNLMVINNDNDHETGKEQEKTLLMDLRKPKEAKPGWNAYHYFNFFYRKWKWNQKSNQPKISVKQVKKAWNILNQEQKKPFVQLSRKHMNKFQNSPPGHVRQTSAAWDLKHKLSLCDYGPDESNDQNWNTWASQVMKEMISNFHFQHPQLSQKEASLLWKEEWIDMNTNQQRECLRQWFNIDINV